jgi:hypothetical protein
VLEKISLPSGVRATPTAGEAGSAQGNRQQVVLAVVDDGMSLVPSMPPPDVRSAPPATATGCRRVTPHLDRRGRPVARVRRRC